MDSRICLENLKSIISMEDEKTDKGQIFSDQMERFFQEIADDSFLMPPLNSRGYKIKHMLWNYLNLKMEIKSKFEEDIFSRWESFPKMPQKAPAETAEGLQGIEKPVDATEKAQLTKQPEPENAGPGSSEKAAKDTPKVPAAKARTSQKAPTQKPAANKPILKKAVIKKPADNKSAVKKREAKKDTAKAPPSKKKTSAVSGAKPRGSDTKKQTKIKSLAEDMHGLAGDFKALEEKIAKMVTSVDNLAAQKAGKKRAVQ